MAIVVITHDETEGTELFDTKTACIYNVKGDKLFILHPALKTLEAELEGNLAKIAMDTLGIRKVIQDTLNTSKAMETFSTVVEALALTPDELIEKLDLKTVMGADTRTNLPDHYLPHKFNNNDEYGNELVLNHIDYTFNFKDTLIKGWHIYRVLPNGDKVLLCWESQK